MSFQEDKLLELSDPSWSWLALSWITHTETLSVPLGS